MSLAALVVVVHGINNTKKEKPKMTYEDAVAKLALARELKTQADDLKAEVADALIPEMESQKLAHYDAENGAKITYIAPSHTRRLDANQAKAGLVSRGVPVSFITESFEAATTIGDRVAYLKYQEPKPKSKKGRR